jgi:hypothetical protein
VPRKVSEFGVAANPRLPALEQSSEVGSKQRAYEVIGLLIPVGFIVIGTVMLIRSRSEERDDD